MLSYEDKIKPQHPQPPPDNLLQQILKELSPKYLGPKAFLSLQQKTLEISYRLSNKELKSKSFCRKYFGKKILYVTNSRGLKRAISSCKLIQRVKFDRSVCSKEGFKATGDFIFIEKDTRIQMKQIKKIVRRCKGKVSFVLQRNVYKYPNQRSSLNNPVVYNYNIWLKKWIRNCNVNLQSLSLTFNRVDQFPDFKENLRNLKHFSLKFSKDFARNCGWGRHVDFGYTFGDVKDKYFTFLLEIIKKTKKLQTLRLDLAPYSIKLAPLAYLLLILSYYKIPDWYVRIGAVSEDFMRVLNGVNIEEINRMAPVGLKSTSEVLKNVNFLGIYVVNYVEEIKDDTHEEDMDYGAFKMSVPRLGELSEVTCKCKRILDVTLTDFSLEKYSIDLKKVLSQFPGLQGLYIKAVENVVIFDEKKSSSGNTERLTDVFRWARNLQEAFITFLTIKSTGEVKIESQTQSFSKLMEVLKTRCPQLNSLNVFRGHPVFHFDGLVRCKKNPLIVPCGEITGMSSLRKLEITSDGKELKSIGKALETLKNLEKFKINIVENSGDFELYYDENACERTFYEFDERENILYYLPGLKELELIINPAGHSVKWADHVAKYIGSLKSLEVFRVIDVNEGGVSLEVFMKIIDGLLRRKTLRKVEMDCMIMKNDPALELAAGIMNNLSKKDVEDLVMKSLKAKIVQMIELNPKLELVSILFFKDMKIDRILYDARTTIS